MDQPAGLVLRAGPGLRWGRAGLLATVAVGLAVGAHTSAGGTLPGAASLALLLAATAGVSAALLGRPASARRVVALLVLAQASAHLWLAVTAAPTMPSMPSMPSMAGHHHGAGAATAAPLAGAASTGATMLLAHLAAAAGVGLWLALGERALWAVLGLTTSGVRSLLDHRPAGARLPLPVPSDLLVRGIDAVSDRSAHLARRQAMLRRSVARRGPPAPSST